MSWANYDSWKLDYPSHWDDEPETCRCCGQELNPDTETCENPECEEFDSEAFGEEDDDESE